MIDSPPVDARVQPDLLLEEWRELCRWDPLLPPESEPPLAHEVIEAVLASLEHPQPLGWGLDPRLEDMISRYAGDAGALDVAVGQLVCLSEAMRRHVTGRVPGPELVEAQSRLTMVLNWAIGWAAHRAAARLEQEAFVDPLTGLNNRRAFDRDLAREVGRASRYSRSFSLATIDLDGLKVVNDTEGHQAGDQRLGALGQALIKALRASDSAYRVGGDEYMVLLPETPLHRVSAIMERVTNPPTPPFSWGAAGYPADGGSARELVQAADSRLYLSRGRQPSRT